MYDNNKSRPNRPLCAKIIEIPPSYHFCFAPVGPLPINNNFPPISSTALIK